MKSWQSALAATLAAPKVTRSATQALLRVAARDSKVDATEVADLRAALAGHEDRFEPAARELANRVVDIASRHGAHMAAAAILSGDIGWFSSALQQRAPTPIAGSNPPLAPVRRGVPLADATPLEHGGPHGLAFLVGGGRSIRNLTVNVVPVYHETDGDGLEMRLMVDRAAGNAIERILVKDPQALLFEKQVIDASPLADGRVVVADADNGRLTLDVGWCVRLDVKGKYRIDYHPEELARPSVRGAVQVTGYGVNEAERKEHLSEALRSLRLYDDVTRGPSEGEQALHKSMRLLWQANPPAAADLASRGKLSMTTVRAALSAAGVPASFLDEARYELVSPDHISLVVPSQAARYRQLGVTAVIHGTYARLLVDVLANGVLASTNARLEARKVVTGMSSDQDVDTGGADYVFARMVVAPGLIDVVNERAVIVMAPEVLSRLDWFAYPTDNYGQTFMGNERGPVSPAIRELVRRSHDTHVQAKIRELRRQASSTSGVNPFNYRPTGRELVETVKRQACSHAIYGQVPNEVMLERSVSTKEFLYIAVASASVRNELLRALAAKGITEVHGTAVGELIQVNPTPFGGPARSGEIDYI